MRILVISDSHRQTKPIAKVLEKHGNYMDKVIHLGDNAPQDMSGIKTMYPNLDVVMVAGNCDYATDEAPSEMLLELNTPAPVKILLLHGHQKDIKSGYNRLMYYALEMKADACLFGHAHIPTVFTHESVFFMCPGSVSLPRGGSRASYGIIKIEANGSISGEIFNL